MQFPEVSGALVEALAAAEAELASFLMILEDGWQGDGRNHFTTLGEAVHELENATGKFERIAGEA